MGQIWPDGKGSERNGEVGDSMAHIYIYKYYFKVYIYPFIYLVMVIMGCLNNSRIY